MPYNSINTGSFLKTMRLQHLQSDKCYPFISENMAEPNFAVIKMAAILYTNENLLCLIPFILGRF